MTGSNSRRLAAEFVGTFILMFTGTGAVVVNEVMNGSVTHVGVGLTFGLVVLAMIYAIGDVSGCHINPAVTVGFALANRFPRRSILPYVVSQCLGAIAASVVLKIMFPTSVYLGGTFPAGSDIQSFTMEFFLTFILMYVVLCVSTGAKEKGILAGVAVGSIIALEALFAGPVSGASMNPARSLAPALVSMHFESLWVYLFATTLGACAGVLVFRVTHEVQDEDSE